ncbi:MAG: Ig-like domain-containing protein [Chloroflexi bacterium]|nr:Ig-like domain-containing protein [Chloroflexota bacterium]
MGPLLALALTLGVATPALAVPSMPHQFYGTVTVGGNPAAGVSVQAKIGSTTFATATTDADGKYGYSPLFRVPGDDAATSDKEGGVNGETVQFYVSGVAAQSAQFSSSGVTELPLSISTVVVQSLDVSPSSASKAKGLTQQFQAKASLSDGSTNVDVTSSATWESSNTSVASIGSSGLATALAVGSTTITATKDGQSDTATLTVTAAVLQSLAVTPGSPSKTAGLTQQFTATGTLTDSATQDITGSVTWSSSSPSVASINASTGLAAALSAGTTTITATQGSITGSTTLTVTAVVISGGGSVQQQPTATPTLVPTATPTPTPTPPLEAQVTPVPTVTGTSSAVVDPTQETRVELEDKTTVVVPPGALSTPVQITARSVPPAQIPAVPAAMGHVRKAVEITLFDTQGAALGPTSLSAAITITVPLSQADIAAIGGDPNNAELYRFDTGSNTWIKLAAEVDLVTGVIRAQLRHLSLFAVVVPAPAVQPAPTPTPTAAGPQAGSDMPSGTSLFTVLLLAAMALVVGMALLRRGRTPA